MTWATQIKEQPMSIYNGLTQIDMSNQHKWATDNNEQLIKMSNGQKWATDKNGTNLNDKPYP